MGFQYLVLQIVFNAERWHLIRYDRTHCLTLTIHHHAESPKQFELHGGHVRPQQGPHPLRHATLQHPHLVGGYKGVTAWSPHGAPVLQLQNR